MHANSRPVVSSQDGIHVRLAEIVGRHAGTHYRAPIAPYSRAAFDQALGAWHAAGEPPLILDAGCGVGLSTLHLAAEHPQSLVLGIDQSADRLGRDTRWTGTRPSNCLLLRADLVDFWRLLQESGVRLAKHYLLYPNPWPKPGHLQRRWHAHPVFPSLIALGGLLECRSNWRLYIEECAAALTQLSGRAVPCEPWLPPQPTTPFEAKYLASGHPLWRCRIALDGSDQPS